MKFRVIININRFIKNYPDYFEKNMTKILFEAHVCNWFRGSTSRKM